MPSSSVSREDGAKADIVLGDRYGTSCATLLIDLVEAALRGRGYTVMRNKPYAGGFITEHYGEPALGRHALQIEINRALYMDERSMQKKPAFAVLADDLTQAFAQVIADIDGELSDQADRSGVSSSAARQAGSYADRSRQEKRPLLPAARSLGRKRPRRATIRRRHRHIALQ